MIVTMFTEYIIVWSLRVGCLDSVNRNIFHVLKSKEGVFVQVSFTMRNEVVLWFFILSMLWLVLWWLCYLNRRH
jgi:hypothetical protein